MQYKTIVLELLQEWAERLPKEKRPPLLPLMEKLALELRDRHLTLIEELKNADPGLDSYQVSAMASEIALKEMEERILQAVSFEEMSFEMKSPPDQSSGDTSND
jgi:hypothetical protein